VLALRDTGTFQTNLVCGSQGFPRPKAERLYRATVSLAEETLKHTFVGYFGDGKYRAEFPLHQLRDYVGPIVSENLDKIRKMEDYK
jgi:hypothetical protein